MNWKSLFFKSNTSITWLYRVMCKPFHFVAVKSSKFPHFPHFVLLILLKENFLLGHFRTPVCWNVRVKYCNLYENFKTEIRSNSPEHEALSSKLINIEIVKQQNVNRVKWFLLSLQFFTIQIQSPLIYQLTVTVSLVFCNFNIFTF